MKRTDLGTEQRVVAYYIVTMIVFSFELSNVKKETNLEPEESMAGYHALYVQSVNGQNALHYAMVNVQKSTNLGIRSKCNIFVMVSKC